MISFAILGIVLPTAVIVDLRTGRIPNWLTVFAAAAGLLASVIPDGIGITQAVAGLAIGLAATLPFYGFGAMGAADVKLMAAAGTLLGASGTALAVLYVFALGGLLALVYAARAGVAARLLRSLRFFAVASMAQIAAGGAPDATDLPLSGVRAPYALAIAGGILAYLATQALRGAGA